jgi:hypothetical protein
LVPNWNMPEWPWDSRRQRQQQSGFDGDIEVLLRCANMLEFELLGEGLPEGWSGCVEGR